MMALSFSPSGIGYSTPLMMTVAMRLSSSEQYFGFLGIPFFAGWRLPEDDSGQTGSGPGLWIPAGRPALVFESTGSPPEAVGTMLGRLPWAMLSCSGVIRAPWLWWSRI